MSRSTILGLQSLRETITVALQILEVAMQLSNVNVICAAQLGGESSEQAKKELLPRFGRLLRYLAGRACKLYGLYPSEAGDIVQNALVSLLDPSIAQFDSGRGDRYEAYLRGLIQNAARSHARFIRKGSTTRHDFADPMNANRNLPVAVDGIQDDHDERSAAENRDHAAAVLVLANPDTCLLIYRVFFSGEAVEQVAISIGVDRSTVSRRLTRFFEQVRVAQPLAC